MTATDRLVLRDYHHTAFSAQELRLTPERVSVCLPARNEVRTIGSIVKQLTPLVGAGVIDEVVVLDDSADGTGEVASAAGATVYEQSKLCPELGPVIGKGDALWRALTVLQGDILVFLDADSEQFGPHYAIGLAGAVALAPGVHFAKGRYRRPFRADGVTLPSGGGRVTELMARPLIDAFFPDLAGFLQPLAGEFAARRDLLLRLPFLCGYCVDLPLLITAWKCVGLQGLAQVDLDVRQNNHRPLEDLAGLARDVLSGVLLIVQEEGRLPASAYAPGAGTPRVVRRPPMTDRLSQPVPSEMGSGPLNDTHPSS